MIQVVPGCNGYSRSTGSNTVHIIYHPPVLRKAIPLLLGQPNVNSVPFESIIKVCIRAMMTMLYNVLGNDIRRKTCNGHFDMKIDLPSTISYNLKSIRWVRKSQAFEMLIFKLLTFFSHCLLRPVFKQSERHIQCLTVERSWQCSTRLQTQTLTRWMIFTMPSKCLRQVD